MLQVVPILVKDEATQCSPMLTALVMNQLLVGAYILDGGGRTCSHSEDAGVICKGIIYRIIVYCSHHNPGTDIIINVIIDHTYVL